MGIHPPPPPKRHKAMLATTATSSASCHNGSLDNSWVWFLLNKGSLVSHLHIHRDYLSNPHRSMDDNFCCDCLRGFDAALLACRIQWGSAVGRKECLKIVINVKYSHIWACHIWSLLHCINGGACTQATSPLKTMMSEDGTSSYPTIALVGEATPRCHPT